MEKEEQNKESVNKIASVYQCDNKSSNIQYCQKNVCTQLEDWLIH